MSEILHSGETVINITEDTVTPGTLARGVTAHDAQGQAIVGEMEQSRYQGKVTLRVNNPSPVSLRAMDDSPVRFSMNQFVVGNTDYERLTNKPRIEGVELIGDKTYEELNLNRITNSEIESILT